MKARVEHQKMIWPLIEHSHYHWHLAHEHAPNIKKHERKKETETEREIKTQREYKNCRNITNTQMHENE